MIRRGMTSIEAQCRDSCGFRSKNSDCRCRQGAFIARISGRARISLPERSMPIWSNDLRSKKSQGSVIQDSITFKSLTRSNLDKVAEIIINRHCRLAQGSPLRRKKNFCCSTYESVRDIWFFFKYLRMRLWYMSRLLDNVLSVIERRFWTDIKYYLRRYLRMYEFEGILDFNQGEHTLTTIPYQMISYHL